MATTPVAVEVWRGGRVESRHRVRACVADATGRLVLAVGDLDAPVFPRSAIKPFQALALVESAAADAFAFGEPELALACASHGGEPMHAALVEASLARLGLDERDLACGAHPPLHPPTAAALIRSGEAPRRVPNNCSGKHAGMLAAALHQRLPTRGYELVDHPVQRHCAAVMQAAPGVLAKTGAEEVYLGAVAASGLGIAIKAEDGGTRAAETALLAVLDRLGALGEAAGAALDRWRRPSLRSFSGRVVGEIAVVDGWPG